MSRLLLLAVALSLAAMADLGRAASDEYNVDIVAVDLAGHRTNLTHDPALDLAPVVARDGWIAFISTRGGTAELYVMQGDGGNVRRVARNAGVAWNEALDVSGGSWSPHSDKLAFDGLYLARGPDCPQHCASWKVSVVGADGSGLEPVALEARAPAWSPHGRFLAYESDLDAYYVAATVTIMPLDGSRLVDIKAINGYSDVGPVWSPRGGEVAFQARPAGGARSWIYVARIDGRTRRLATGHNPTWSADGRRLTFIDGYKLFSIGRDGKGRRRLSPKGEFVVGAAWSPKGGTIGYVAGTKAGRYGGAPTNLRVETVSPDGKRVRVLARERAASLVWGRPVWTPDGKRLLVAVEPH